MNTKRTKGEANVKTSDVFLTEIDGMIESTEEFIADDGLRADDQRIHDLSALIAVRDLYAEHFIPDPEEDLDVENG
jgi:hypothetical protein